jgi:SAM-dependent methyltransferase
VRTDQFARGQRETVDSFSWKWNRARNYRGATLAHYSSWYLQRYGFADESLLRTFLASKGRILDAGTAHGRDAEMYLRNSRATVFGVDISHGVRDAYRDLGQLPNLHFVQADLGRLPFAEGFFDFIACDQVIHHTPDTRASLQHLLTRLAPGGHISFYVYRVKGPVREFCDDYIRAQTVAMGPEDCYRVSEAITKFGKSLSDLKITIDVPEDIPVLGIKAGKQDLQRFIYWNVFKCYWNDAMDWESNVITNFDWYHPLHAHRHTREEIEGWCREAQLTIEHLDEQESGISVRARKASSSP